MEIRQYIGIIRHWLWLIVLSVVLSSGISYAVSRNLPKVYQASTTLIVGTVTTTPNPDYASVMASQQLAKTYSKILTTRPILEGAIESTKLADRLTAIQLAGAVSVETVRDTQLIIVRVRSQDPALASQLANAVADELLQQSPTSPQGRLGAVMTFVQKQMDDLEGEISTTQNRIKELKDKQSATPSGSSASATAVADELATTEAKLRSAQERYGTLLTVRAGMSTSYVSVIEKAEIPAGPISPNTRNNVAFAALLGLLLSLGIAFFIEYLDDTARSPELISQTMDLPTLGIVSRLPEKELAGGPITIQSPKSSSAEAFRALRTSIQFASPDKPLGTLLVTSSDPGDGKTTVLANLSVCLAQAGIKVIAIDTDLRRPALHRIFGLPNNVGLTSLLSGQATEIASVMQPTDEPNLSVITCGPLPPNPSELLSSHRFENVVARLKGEADLLVFDSPPVHAVADAVLLSTKVDGVVVVVDTGHTRMASLKQAVESVRKVGGAPLGAILNKVGREDGRYYYYNYYYYYYYYYYASDDKASGNGHNKNWLGKLFSNGRGQHKSGRSRQGSH